MVAILKTKQEVITDWAQCWFGESKRTGYVSVTDFKMQKFYGAKDINALKRDTKGIEKRFISLNAFTFGSRESANLKQIRNIGIDLDQYKFGLTIDEGIDELHSLILDKIIPEPNLVLTSRGIQIFYTIKNGAAPNISWLSSYVTDQLIGKLGHIGADCNAKDLSRVMRVPDSINERNGAIVKPEIWCPEPYTIQELQEYCKPLDQFNYKGKKKAKLTRFVPKSHDRLSFFYRTNHIRLLDLEKLIELRKGDLTNMRNSFMYVYAFHQSLICSSFAQLEAFAENIFSRIYSKEDKPMTKTEFKRVIKSAYKDAEEFFAHLRANDYRVVYKSNDGIKKPYKTSNLIEKFNITEDEQRAMRRLVGGVVAKEKDAERKKEERRAAGVKSRDEYLKPTNDKLSKLKLMLENNPDLTHKELSEALECSTKTIQRLTKKL